MTGRAVNPDWLNAFPSENSLYGERHVDNALLAPTTYLDLLISGRMQHPRRCMCIPYTCSPLWRIDSCPYSVCSRPWEHPSTTTTEGQYLPSPAGRLGGRLPSCCGVVCNRRELAQFTWTSPYGRYDSGTRHRRYSVPRRSVRCLGGEIAKSRYVDANGRPHYH